ncbi:MAG: ribonuclease HI [Bacteroidetes bacterium]|nr:ribonuclease HI [Bacteroidota bacterium]
MSQSNQLIIYTDGAARGNPGRGGYGILLFWGTARKELSAGYRHTTNNRMELLAVIKSLASLNRKGLTVKVYTDSRYIVDSVQKGWLNNWIRTDFKGGKKNKDLWLQYHALAAEFNITFHWVKGHASNPHNNRCDELATMAADGHQLLQDQVYEQESGYAG